MVATFRRGFSSRHVAPPLRIAASTVLFWIRRAGTQHLDRVDWSDRARGPRIPANTYSRALEDLVLSLRRQLKETGDLGEVGAEAIQRVWQVPRVTALPSGRPLGRILKGRDALDGHPRPRRPAPPRGWSLPDVAAGQAGLDSFDIVEGLVIKGGTDVDVLHGLSLPGGLVASWPRTEITGDLVVKALLQHWHAVGLPAYAPCDNDTRFQGPHQHPDTLGRSPPRVFEPRGGAGVCSPARERGSGYR